MSTERPSIESWHLHATGRVQGVGYRESCVRVARSLGLCGWVRNRIDGSVEALAQGPAEALAHLRAWMLAGPALARVDSVEVTPRAKPTEPLERFERRPTA